MWAATPATSPTQFLHCTITTASNTLPQQRHQQRCHHRRRNPQLKYEVSAGEMIGRLGQTIVAGVDSNDNLQISEENQGQEEEKEISGSEVLWAMQRASAEKKKSKSEKRKKKNTVREPSSSVGGSTGDRRVDYSNVRPLRIKAEWGPKLEKLEKLLKELQEKEI